MKLPVPAPQLSELLEQDKVRLDTIIGRGVKAEVEGIYEHWDHLRHLTPPKGLTSEGWWAALKVARSVIARQLPLRDKAGIPFSLSCLKN